MRAENRQYLISLVSLNSFACSATQLAVLIWSIKSLDVCQLVSIYHFYGASNDSGVSIDVKDSKDYD